MTVGLMSAEKMWLAFFICSCTFRKISESVFYIRHVCLSVRPNVRMKQLGVPLDGFL